MKYSIAIALILIGISINGQSLPQHNEFSEWGFSFDVPTGWSANQEGAFIMMGHQTIAGLMIMSTNEASSAEQLKNEAMEGLIDEGVNLKPTEIFQINGSRVTGNYEGIWDGTEVICHAIGLMNSGGIGINILVVTTVEMFSDQHKVEAEKLAKSVKFFKPKESDQSIAWRNRLVPGLVKYLSSSYSTDYSGGSSGTRSNESITLCSNGYFSYYSNNNATFTAGDGAGGESGSGYANSNGSSQGQYEFITIGDVTYLILNFEGGQVYEYSLNRNDEGHTLLNGTRYFVVETDACN